jgi:hypothetical protein
VSRRWDDAERGYVIHKAMLGQDALARLRHVLAPEQTARTGRAVDQRLDFYGIGYRAKQQGRNRVAVASAAVGPEPISSTRAPKVA